MCPTGAMLVVRSVVVLACLSLWCLVEGMNSTRVLTRVAGERSLYQMATHLVGLQRNALYILFKEQGRLTLVVPESGDRALYLQNLVNGFLLAQRVTWGWPLWIDLMYIASGGRVKTPRLQDSSSLADSAVTALIRLQEMYDLSTRALAEGLLEGSWRNSQLRASDCFAVGVKYFQLQHHKRALEWLLEALEKTPDESVSRSRVLEYLYLAQCFNGDSRRSLQTLQRLLEETPKFVPSQELSVNHSSVATRRCSDIAEDIRGHKLYRDQTAPHVVWRTRGLCEKHNLRWPDDPELRCRLLTYGHPHLRIRPLKMEELHLDPPLLLFRDVIHPREIQQLKTFFHNKTKWALEQDYDEFDLPDRYQDTQHSANVDAGETAEERRLATAINQRAASMCGLGLQRSEPLMLASYGLGAELKLHYDHVEDMYIFDDNQSKSDFLTIIFYMNEVLEGGHTIFPSLGLAVPPVTGGALVWFNRRPDWSLDVFTRHAGCPILRGQKWILTKWFNVLGQDFPRCLPGREKTHKYFYLQHEK